MAAESRTPVFDAMNAPPAEEETTAAGGDAGTEAPAASDTGTGGGQPRAPDGKFAAKNADGSAKTAGEAEGKGVNQRVDTVPYSALLKERAELKRLKDELRERDERFARLDQRLNMIQEGWQAPQPAKEPDLDLGPDPEQDPVGAAKWLREQRAAELKRQREWEAEQAKQAKTRDAQQKEWEAFQADLAASNREWEETLAHYPQMNQVLEGVRESMRRELTALGWHGPQLIQRLGELEAQHAVYAQRTGKPIGEYVAQLAIARGVLQPPQAQAGGGPAQPEPAAQPAQAPNGKAAAPDPAAENIKQLAAAQAAAQTLSGAGGSPGGGKIDLDALDRMTDDELRTFIASKDKQEPGGFEKWKRRMMVGA
jgi:hypothetical protein